MEPPPVAAGGVAAAGVVPEAPAGTDGRNRRAIVGTRSTSSFRLHLILTLAVIPGMRMPSGFPTAMIVVGDDVLDDEGRLPDLDDLAPNDRPWKALDGEGGRYALPGRRPTSAPKSMAASTCIRVRSSAMVKSVWEPGGWLPPSG